MTKALDATGAIGDSPSQWRDRLSRGLETGDSTGLEEILKRLGAEIKEETRAISSWRNGPLTDRLLEQVRRLLQSEPTEQEQLLDELKAERALWAEYRLKYRQTFVPKILHPYLDDLALFIAPSKAQPLYAGFDKYSGLGTGRAAEAITLFDPKTAASHGDSVGATHGLGYEEVPNFLCAFFAPSCRFVIRRAFRGDLPRGAGEACLFEQLKSLSRDPKRLARLTVENVQNTETYDVFVSRTADSTALVKHPKIDRAPLVRLGRRLIERCGRSPGRVWGNLDPYGFLDLQMDVV